MTEKKTLPPEGDRRSHVDRRRPHWAQPKYSLVALVVALCVVGVGAYVANQLATNGRVRHDLVNECERVKSVKIATNLISGIARFTATAGSRTSDRLHIKLTKQQRQLQRTYGNLVNVIPDLPIVPCDDIVDHPERYTAEGFLKTDKAGISHYMEQVHAAEKFLNKAGAGSK